MYLILDDQSNLERVQNAHAATRDDPTNLDYVVIGGAAVHGLNIKIRQTEGETPDAVVNANWHCEFFDLSLDQVIGLAHIIRDTARFRISGKAVAERLRQARTDGMFDEGRMKERLLRKLDGA